MSEWRLLELHPQTLFDFFEAGSFINEIRAPQKGFFDASATARALGYEIKAKKMATGIYGGYYRQDRQIFVAIGQSQYQTDLTVGHEMGHILVDLRFGNNWDFLFDDDPFAEYFAHKLVDYNIDGELAIGWGEQ